MLQGSASSEVNKRFGASRWCSGTESQFREDDEYQLEVALLHLEEILVHVEEEDLDEAQVHRRVLD